MRKSNTELITDIITFSEHGGMAQLVVMEAIGSEEIKKKLEERET